ncbi:MAG TPA: serine/threonine-protein kinase [Streptosporangiaceae bacterium]|nr:serine/threonine-protein kinase [Streptosporangiaceae bacterium]
MTDDNAPARADVRPGDKVAGYLLEEQIGQGGMAVVYRAYDERLDRRVALKVLAPSLAADNAFRTRFIRESRAAATVEHPNIIPVYDAGDAGGCLFISMRYVQGGDVRALLADGKGLPPARAWNIINQVASALDMAHSHNLVHRDVKPANMLIDASAKEVQRDVNTSGPVTEHIYLSDFGISKQTVASHLTSTGQFVGTLDYIAPEQIEGQSIDGRADQYSLACAAFELLCGAPPFTGPNVFALINSHLSEQPPPATKLRPALPPDADRVLAKAMDKTPARRYATCAQFASDLGRALGLVPGPLDADGGRTVTPAGAGEQAEPHHQATELAGPAVAAALGDQSRLVARTAQESAGTPPPAAAVAPGATPTGAGAPAVTDEQTMTAGMPGAASGQALYAPPAGAQQQWQAGPGQPAYGQPAYGQQALGQQAPGRQAPGQQAPGQQALYGQYQPLQTYPQPGGPGGPGPGGGGTGWPQFTPQQQPQKRARGVLVGAVVGALVVAGAAAAVAVTLLNNNSSGNGPRNGLSSSAPPVSSSAPADGQTQAAAMSSLLSQMTQSHQALQTAVLDIEDNCSSLSASQMSSDVAAIRTAAGQRQSEYNQAKGLAVSALPSGTTAKANLTRALFYSLQADNNYLTWAQQEQNGCFVSSQSSAYNAANNDSTQANAAKSNFATIWNNQIAPTYNEPTVAPGNL